MYTYIYIYTQYVQIVGYQPQSDIRSQPTSACLTTTTKGFVHTRVNHGRKLRGFTFWQTYKKLLKMAIEIVDLPIKNGDFP